MNIILVGLMGAGKSAVGRILAETLGRPFIDTDAEVVAAAGRSIPEIFAAEGEAAFRRRETDVITSVVTHENQVIATGGGAVLRPENRASLRAAGTVIWLDAPPAELLRRAEAQGIAQRPLLADADPLQALETLAKSRAEAYQAAAHHRVQTAGKPPQAVARLILAILKETNADGEG